MFGLQALDVLIGLVTVYLVFALACTAIVEAIAAWSKVRSTNLEAALREFLHGNLTDKQKFVDAFFRHPLVQSISRDENSRPSYIPPETVGHVMQSLVTANGTILTLKDAVEALPGTPESNRIKGLLGTLLTQANGDAAAFRKLVETHFNAVMDRAAGWVKRRQQTVALIVSTVLVLGANVDTVALATSLAGNPEARATMVKTASDLLTNAKEDVDQVKADPEATANQVKEAEEESKAAKDALETATSVVQSAGLHFGWEDWWTSNPTLTDILAKAAGLLVSILAVSLGAPFWFDLLQRFMQVRATGARQPTDTNKKK
jgi:hypothetical protein